MKSNTVDAAEIEKFSRRADEWWNTRGPFAPLHRINPLRIQYIKEQSGTLAGRTLLDIGCGGGLVCEPMARLGATVTGIDASAENIETAKSHAAQSDLNINYLCTTAEDLLTSPTTNNQQPTTFDIVLALEIVEHVANVPLFIETTCKLVKPGGLIIYSTLNRTLKSFALGIVAAEYILRLVPRGTHEWEKFLKPSELARELRRNGVEISSMTGMAMNPLTWKWELNPRDLGVNYFLAGVKR